MQTSVVNKLVVIGAGQMGGGIALTAARMANMPVCLVDSNAGSIEKQRSLFKQLLSKDVKREKITIQQADEIIGRIRFETNLAASVEDADFVIEAIPEDLDLKADLFKKLSDNLKNADCIVATNTSSISITKLASLYKRPMNVVGMHFMNPVPVMQLVEVIKAMQTTDGVVDKVMQLAGAMGKTCIVAPDTPAFTANRLLAPYLNEAVQLLFENGWRPDNHGDGGNNNKHAHAITPDSIDQIMKLGSNVPMGPLRLADFVGLDTLLSIMNVLDKSGLGSGGKYAPSPLLSLMVDAGWLGKKTGRGFYNDYN